MKNIRLYAKYSGIDKILVDMSNYVYDINYGKIIHFVTVDLFQPVVTAE